MAGINHIKTLDCQGRHESELHGVQVPMKHKHTNTNTTNNNDNNDNDDTNSNINSINHDNNGFCSRVAMSPNYTEFKFPMKDENLQQIGDLKFIVEISSRKSFRGLLFQR